MEIKGKAQAQTSSFCISHWLIFSQFYVVVLFLFVSESLMFIGAYVTQLSILHEQMYPEFLIAQ